MLARGAGPWTLCQRHSLEGLLGLHSGTPFKLCVWHIIHGCSFCSAWYSWHGTRVHPDTQAMRAVNNNRLMAGSGAAGCHVSQTPRRVPMPIHSRGCQESYLTALVTESPRDRSCGRIWSGERSVSSTRLPSAAADVLGPAPLAAAAADVLAESGRGASGIRYLRLPCLRRCMAARIG